MSLIFNGSTDYVTVSDNVSLDITDDLTISVWINPNAISTDEIVIKRVDDTHREYELRIDGSDEKIHYLDNSDNIAGDSTISINTWTHVTLVRDISVPEVKFYINGESDGSDSITGGLSATATDVIIGARELGAQYLFNGIIDDVRIWNRALSLEEITDCYRGTAPRNGLVAEWLMNEGFGSTAYDTSVNSNDGTITGATWGNDFTSNPWIIKAAASGDVSTSLPTYNGNTGIHVAYGIVSFYWTGATATHVCEVKDVSAERIWKSVCTTTNIEPKFKPCEPIFIKGLNISTLESGTLYIYHT